MMIFGKLVCLFRRHHGPWRAVKLMEPGIDLTPVFTDEGTLYVLSADPVRPGSFKSPRDALEKYLTRGLPNAKRT